MSENRRRLPAHSVIAELSRKWRGYGTSFYDLRTHRVYGFMGLWVYVEIHQEQRHDRRLPHQMEVLQRQAYGFKNFRKLTACGSW